MKYRIISAIDYLSGEDAIYRTLAGEVLPERFHDLGSICEHCNQNRQRKTVYALVSDGGGYAQVGSTCLREYIGGDESELIAAYRDQYEADEEERVRFSRSIELQSFLAQVSAVIAERGWLGVAKARENGGTPTAELARAFECKPAADDVVRAGSAVAWARELADNGDDYLHNLRVLASESRIDPKHIGLAASMIVAWERAIAREAERVQHAAVSDYVGIIGKRETFMLTVARVIDIDGQYGVTHVHQMRDDGGNVVVWFATAEKLEPGRYAVTGSVKSHGERNGVKQTVITRCKAQRITE